MISKIISAVEKTVAPGKENAGQTYFVANCEIGDEFTVKAAKLAIFFTGTVDIDTPRIERWREYIKAGKYPEVDLRHVVVGDTSQNPNEKPLPRFRFKKDGVVQPEEYTSLTVLVRFSNGAPIESPRNVALRIIKNLCEPVIETGVASAPEADVL